MMRQPLPAALQSLETGVLIVLTDEPATQW